MNKSEFIQYLASYLTKKRSAKNSSYKNPSKEGVAHAQESLTIFLDSITEALKIGDRVEIRKLGTFQIRNFKAYRSKTPGKNTFTPIPPRKSPHFKPSKKLKAKLIKKAQEEKN